MKPEDQKALKTPDFIYRNVLHNEDCHHDQMQAQGLSTRDEFACKDDSFDEELHEFEVYKQYKDKQNRLIQKYQEKQKLRGKYGKHREPKKLEASVAREATSPKELFDRNAQIQQDRDPISTIRSNVQKKLIKQRDDDEKMIDILLSGTSATLVIQNDATKQIHVSWVGDSMFTVCTGSDTPKKAKNNAQVWPHKATMEKERFRIFSSKGEIRQNNDFYHRVYMRGRLYPGMKTTRSIGDLLAHQIGVTSEPDFVSYHLSFSDKWFIVGVDSLWKYFNCPEKLINFISQIPASESVVHGYICDKIFQRVRDSSTKLLQHDDLTFLISFLI